MTEPDWFIQYGDITLEGYSEDGEVVLEKKNRGIGRYMDMPEEDFVPAISETLEVSPEEVEMTAEYLQQRVEEDEETTGAKSGTRYHIGAGETEVSGRTMYNPIAGEMYFSKAAREVKEFYERELAET